MTKQAKIAVAGIVHETNSFAPDRTELSNFRHHWVDPAQFVETFAGTFTTMGGVIDTANRLNAALVPCFYTEATPSGMVSGAAMTHMIDTLTASLPASDAYDGLVLIMHGAMVSESYPDVEGEVLRRVREKIGPEVPIAMTLDLHGNISREMVELSTLIVGYNTYPHIDTYEVGVEATELLARTIAGDITPVQTLGLPRMLVSPQSMITTAEPMKQLMDRAFAMEQLPGVLNVTVAGGFPFSDIAIAGMAFVVDTDGNAELGQRLTDELTALCWELREQFDVPQLTVEEALRLPLPEDGPSIWIEGSDNVGAGSPADATHVLQHLIGHDAKSLIVICDPESAAQAAQVGIDGTFSGLVGGKSDKLHGEPVQLVGRVRLLSDGQYTFTGAYMAGKKIYMGLTAVVESGAVTVVLTSERVMPFDIGHVHSIGIRPEDYRIIVVKSAVAWRTAFGHLAAQEVFLDTPGCCSANLHHFSYKHVARPIYPLDPNFK